jgi:hypothetical protein
MLLKKAAEFKARPPVILSKKPFVPAKTEKHEVKALNFHLNTEIRAKDRALYDLKRQMKEREIEELKLQVSVTKKIHAGKRPWRGFMFMDSFVHWRGLRACFFSYYSC